MFYCSNEKEFYCKNIKQEFKTEESNEKDITVHSFSNEEADCSLSNVRDILDSIIDDVVKLSADVSIELMKENLDSFENNNNHELKAFEDESLDANEEGCNVNEDVNSSLDLEAKEESVIETEDGQTVEQHKEQMLEVSEDPINAAIDLDQGDHCKEHQQQQISHGCDIDIYNEKNNIQSPSNANCDKEESCANDNLHSSDQRNTFRKENDLIINKPKNAYEKDLTDLESFIVNSQPVEDIDAATFIVGELIDTLLFKVVSFSEDYHRAAEFSIDNDLHSTGDNSGNDTETFIGNSLDDQDLNDLDIQDDIAANSFDLLCDSFRFKDDVFPSSSGQVNNNSPITQELFGLEKDYTTVIQTNPNSKLTSTPKSSTVIEISSDSCRDKQSQESIESTADYSLDTPVQSPQAADHTYSYMSTAGSPPELKLCTAETAERIRSVINSVIDSSFDVDELLDGSDEEDSHRYFLNFL